MITAGNQVLFRHGFGCGACYQVLCNQSPHCSRKPIRVSLTDEFANNRKFSDILPMQQMFGAIWSAHINPNTQKPPFSLRLTSEYKHQIKANNIIPVDWQSRTIYKSNVNFPNKL
nr:putative expansin-B2 [Nicotiana tomentosiformis]